MKLAADDIQSRKAQEARDLRFLLQDLLMQLTAAQSLFAEEQRAFRTDRESLVTDLERIKAEADIAFTQAQTTQLARKEALHRSQNEEFRVLTAKIHHLIAEQEQLGLDVETEQYRKLKEVEKDLRDSRHYVSAVDEDLEDENPYPPRISDLEREKREMMQAIREDAHTTQDRILELGMHLDGEEAEFKAEVAQLNAKMKKQEETYKKQLDRLYMQVEQIQTKRGKIAAATETKVKQWEQKIEAVDAAFREKLGGANRIAETLKSSLITANIRKTQHLEIERKRALDEQQIVQESLILKQEVFDLQQQVEKAKE
jgi:hypothetical protein